MSSRSTKRRGSTKKGKTKARPSSLQLQLAAAIATKNAYIRDLDDRNKQIDYLEARIHDLEGVMHRSEEATQIIADDISLRRAASDIVNKVGLGSMPPNPNQEQFSTGAVRRKTSECRLDLIPLEALEGYGDRLHFGATVRGYGERNWEKGIPYSNLIQHAQTHLSKLASQLINSEANNDVPMIREQVNTHGEDLIYGNACAALWNIAAIVTFLRRGNPAENHHCRNQANRPKINQ